MKLKRKQHTEVIIIVLLNILYFFTIRSLVPSMLYIFLASVMALYYNPIEIIRHVKAENYKGDIIISVLISSTITLSIITYFIGLKSSLKIALLICLLAYWLILFFYRKIKTPQVYLLIVTQFLAVNTYFSNFE